MQLNKKKIINDPVYGFISIQHELIFDIIAHPYFQRLRRIKQLGWSNLVYPGALHTRFQHALGAMHLSSKAIESLRSKGIEINQEEERNTLIAILLHDIGHGPFSHSLEHSILNEVDHEDISLSMMNTMNEEFGGQLTMAIEIFKGSYHKKFLHQLISGQLDMDRLDYLRRDSFYTGVSEGTIGLERIIQMINVFDDNLVVDQKGIYSIEKFIMARRFMYWQVYLHKTSLAADQVMLSILRRAKRLITEGLTLFGTPSLLFFLSQNISLKDLKENPRVLEEFSQLDDSDIVSAIKVWQNSGDVVLATLCDMLINRNLPKIKISNEAFSAEEESKHITSISKKLGISAEDAKSFVYRGDLANSTYSSESEQINILYKDGTINDIAKAAETYTFLEDEKPTIKYFISYPK